MAEDKPIRKPFTDDQKDFLFDFLLEKFMDDLRKDEMRRKDFYNQPPETDPEGKPILSANMGGMISIDELTKPIGMKKGMTTNPVLNKVLKTKNIGSLVDEIGGASASMGMGQDLPGVGFEEALQEQPGERVSTKASNVDKDVKRDYIKKGRIELANIKPKDSTVKSVKVGTKGLPFLEKNTQAGANKYVKNTIKYVQSLGGNEASKVTQGGSFMGATGYGELRNETWSKAKSDPKVLKKFFTEVKGKQAETAKFNHKGKSYKLNVKIFNPFFEKKTGYVTKGGAKNFVQLVDQEIVKKGGNLTGKAGLVKNFILNEAQRLYRIGDKIGAKNILIALGSYIPAIAKAAPLGPIDLFIPSPMGSGELPQEGTPEYEQLMKDMGKNQGGMMDINFMTRPLGYKDGTRGGSTVGDLEKLLNESRKNVQKTIDENVSGVISDADRSMVEKSLPFPGLREFAASEVMRAAGDQKRVDTIQLASNYLRSIGMSGNEAAMNNVINILNTQIVPEEELKIMKEGESSLGKGMQGIGRGIEGLLQFLKLQEEGTGKFQTLDDRTLQKLIEMRTQ